MRCVSSCVLPLLLVLLACLPTQAPAQTSNAASDGNTQAESSRPLNKCLAELGQSETADGVRDHRAQASMALGRKYKDARQNEEALAYLTRIPDLTTDGNTLAESYIAASECLFGLQRYDDALAAARAVPQIQDTGWAYVERRADWVIQATAWEVRCILHSASYDKAVRVCDDAIAKFPEAGDGYVRELKLIKANAYLLAGKLDDAIGVARGIHADNISPKLNVLMDQMVGDYYLQAGKYDEAIAAYKHVISQNSGFSEIEAGTRYMLASCYEHTGDRTAARDCLREVVEYYTDTSWKPEAEKKLATYVQAGTRAGTAGRTGSGGETATQ